MKVIKTASGNQIKMSKSEWEEIGKTAMWGGYTLIDNIRMNSKYGLPLNTMDVHELEEAKKYEAAGKIKKIKAKDKDGLYYAYVMAQSNNQYKTAEKFKVVDNDFNRANYPDMIGKILDTPPAYAIVESIADTDED